jgi:ADP-ribose pyrophosphatase
LEGISMPLCDKQLAEYLALSKQRPDLFESSEGELPVLLDPEVIQAVQSTGAQRLEQQTPSDALARVGLILDDPWFFVLRDAVEFPDGSRRLYSRVISKKGHGSAVLPVLDGRIVLIRQFRHAIRRWLLEIPRGGMEPGQSSEDVARAEVKEEIGGVIDRLVPIGFVYGATHLYNTGSHLFMAELSSIGAPQLAEGITAIELVTRDEFEQLMLRGDILDGITVAAFSHARLKGLV